MKKERQIANHKRRAKRSLKSRQRHKRYLKTKWHEKNRETKIKREIRKMKPPKNRWHPKMVWDKFKRWYCRWILCSIGRHLWVKQSGLPGTPKYWCSRCNKQSKITW